MNTTESKKAAVIEGMFNNGRITQNEARAMYGLPPLDDPEADKLYVRKDEKEIF